MTAYSLLVIAAEAYLHPISSDSERWKISVRVQGASENANTVFAKLIITSNREQVQKIKFGFSDAVKVYCDDRLLYGGSDVFVSRDYRFLGMIDLFDEVYFRSKQATTNCS